MLKKLTDFLNTEKVKYVAITHSPAYTAQEIAALAHIPGREVAKTVIVKVDGRMCMAVLPASSMVDFTQLRQGIAAAKVELATEGEFKGMFPDCEVGAMPPFGNLFGMNVYVDKMLAEDSEIAFNAGTNKELVRMDYKDFARIVAPKLLAFGVRKKTHGAEPEVTA